ncbi:MAG: hypothetical protein ABSF33_01450 [Acidimicrobiales bacterium]
MGPQTVNRGRRTRGAVVAGVTVLALVASACGSGSSSPPTSSVTTGDTSVVALATPTDELEGCTYTVNGQIDPSLPTGERPHFSAFSPDPSAEAAINSIKSKGGTAAVDTFQLPYGTKLRSGPSSSAPVVGKVPGTDQLELYDPIVWTDSAGQKWLATFIACGGRNLYWAGLADLQATDPTAARTVRTQLAQLRSARPYLQTAKASYLPILIDSSGHVDWKDKVIPFSVGRAELVSADI